MKALDEVIKAFECCLDGGKCLTECPYKDGCLDDCEKKDALYYLNEYATSLHNEPLTWSELKEMIGKPVWIEIGDGSKGWVIIRHISDIGMVTGSDNFIGFKAAYGHEHTWQAYRREQE